VVVVSVGDDESEEALVGCLAKGADRAIRIADDGVQQVDSMAIARLLAAIVERERPDLVLCGVQSADTVNGATGAALAGLSGLPCVAVVRDVELSRGREAVVERELEGGTVERVRVSLPALLTVQTGINKPRYATLRAIKQAREKPLETVAPAELGLDDAVLAGSAGARLRGLHVPVEEGHAEMLEGDASSVAARIAELVKERVA
jgi:electron transfer flavoprotein beta subunit